VYRSEAVKPDKPPTKVPYCAANTSRKASSTDPATWTDLKTALDVHTRSTGYFNGIVFALANLPLVAFDLDDCIINGELHPFAQQLLVRCGDTYVEITPSGTGLRVIGRGDGPPIHNKYLVGDGASCEIYRKPTGRFITVTGKLQ
jgi:putative DNA primase/helicase